MKKTILIIINLIFIYYFIFTQENTNDVNNNNKAIEISIGGSASLLCDFEGLVRDSFSLAHLYNVNMSYSIPFSYVFYPIKYFGLGFNCSIGFSSSMVPLLSLPLYIIQNKINFINKFGSIINKKWFLLEYGLAFNYTFVPKFNYLNEYQNMSAPFFNIGPNIFSGYEYIKNYFSFSVGVTYSGVYYLFYYVNITNETGEHYGLQLWHHYLGIEFRWRFAYFKMLK